MKSGYSELMNDDFFGLRKMGVDPNDPAASFLKKDYRELMNAVDKKQGK